VKTNFSQESVTLACSTLTLRILCIEPGKVCSKLTYALQTFSTPKVHVFACTRLAGWLAACFVALLYWIQYYNGLVRAHREPRTE